MSIENNLNIFYMATGLVAAEGENYTYWPTKDGHIYRLIMEVGEVSVDAEIKAWFLRAKKQDWQHGNPYARRFRILQPPMFN